VALAETVPGTATATSASTTNTSALGKYCWRAEYSGDAVYPADSHTNATTECFTVAPICGDGIVDPELGETCDGTDLIPWPNGVSGDFRHCRAPGAIGECTYCGDDAALVGVIPAPKGLDACDPAEDPTGCPPGGVELCDDGDSSNSNNCNNSCQRPDCSVNIIKETSCDGGATFGDGCSTLDTANVSIQYRYSNTGDADLYNCRVDETNTVLADIPPSITLLTVDLEQTNPRITDQCSTVHAGGEPDDATITCDCGDPTNPFDTTDWTDGSDFTCETCQVQIDKQVSCDGSTWHDVGNDGDGLGQAPDCSELNGQQVHSQYIVSNSGQTDVRCTIDDSNNAFIVAPIPTNPVIIPGGQNATSSTFNAECNDGFEANEPDTANLSCECLIGGEVVDTKTDSDIANIECLSCDVKVDKAVICEGQPVVDQTLVYNNEDGTYSCTADDGDNITVE
jgi:hypothetical protein